MLRQRIKISILMCLALASVLFAGAVITEFKAEPGRTNEVVITWTATAEDNLKGYQIWRRFEGQEFQKIADLVEAKLTQSGKDSYTYTYTDDKVFKNANSRTFYYKLYFVNSDNTTLEYEHVVSTAPQISAARHTWGSIKAMFR